MWQDEAGNGMVVCVCTVCYVISNQKGKCISCVLLFPVIGFPVAIGPNCEEIGFFGAEASWLVGWLTRKGGIPVYRSLMIIKMQ